jgi:predicted RNase H-like nuclease (RuvC/YqgF family)
MSRVSLTKALVKLLKGTNYAIIYSGSGKNHAVVSKVFVYTKSERSRISGRSISQDNRLAARIKTYEKRIELMNKKLSHLDKNSRMAKRYVKQIRSYENIIENLKKRIR